MAELNLGTSLSADDYLDLVTAVNRRRNKSNAMLRGLGALTGTTPTMRTSSGFDTSLRAYSKAKDEEILSSIIGYAADHDFLDADGMFDENMFRDWFAEQGLPDKMYEKSAAEFRKRAGRFESVLSATQAKAAAAHARKMEPGKETLQGQQIEAGKRTAAEAKKKDIASAMSIVSQGAARDDIEAIVAGADYDAVVQDRLKESDGWDKAALELYRSMMAESGLKPDAPTGAMKGQLEKRGLVRPVSEGTFDEMTDEDAAETRRNYLSLTQLIKSDQRQNVLLQGLTQGPMAKNTYDQINMIVEIEDPQFFQRVFEVPNPYELYARFKEVTAGLKPDRVKQIEEEFVRKAVQKSGWEPDHIYSMIRPEKFGVGAKYSRYRLGG